METNSSEAFKKGDVVVMEGMYKDYRRNEVIRTTKTWAILDDGKKLPIHGVDGCHEIWNYHNQHGRHMETFYRLRADVLKRAAANDKYWATYLLNEYRAVVKELSDAFRGTNLELNMPPFQRKVFYKIYELLKIDQT